MDAKVASLNHENAVKGVMEGKEVKFDKFLLTLWHLPFSIGTLSRSSVPHFLLLPHPKMEGNLEMDASLKNENEKLDNDENDSGEKMNIQGFGQTSPTEVQIPEALPWFFKSVFLVSPETYASVIANQLILSLGACNSGLMVKVLVSGVLVFLPMRPRCLGFHAVFLASEIDARATL
ncbi:Hypothetical predicted protein [Olea europaea subsp. europaea]|uniref:Uncharacterized protein n=1 Tax=Olea europaea subsp. europaea TaxID=158383 RepID=A0A8S0UBJ6_OLEEU|nr:Hypothetical predicted protein [Olea europaea subsp. europaea]